MSGSLKRPITMPSAISASAITKYGSFTEDASCKRYACSACADRCRTSSMLFGALLRISQPPRYGAIVVPSELNACVRFSRLDAVRDGPSTATYGLAETCSAVIPAASTINAARNSGNDGTLAAGINISAPNPMVSRPATIVFLYPIQSITLPDGIEKTKYAEKNAN